VRAVRAPEADAYLVVADTAAVASVIEAHADLLEGRPVLLVPGGVGGAAATYAWFAERGRPIRLDTWAQSVPTHLETRVQSAGSRGPE
jgi:hypothetical protein